MTVGAMIPARESADDAGTDAASETGFNLKPLLITLAVFGYMAAVNWRWMIPIAIMLVTIVVHEFGHFITARWGGMRATEFFVGFGPASSKIWSFRRGETEYGIKAILAGGYVKTPGMTNLEEIEPEHEARTYRAATYPRRFLHVAAGPGINLLVALVGFCGFFTAYREPDESQMLIEVVADSPAAAAGLLTGDVVTALNGESFERIDEYLSYLREHPGATIDIAIERGGEALTIATTLADSHPSDPAKPGVGYLGVKPAWTGDELPDRNLVEGIGRGFDEFGTQFVGTIKGIAEIFSPSGLGRLFETVTGQREDTGQRASSTIGIVKDGSEFANSWRNTIWLFLVLNLAIGMFNLLPLIPFDGGHLLIATYERLRSRRTRYYVDFARVVPFFAPFLVIIVFVVGSAIILDFRR